MAAEGASLSLILSELRAALPTGYMLAVRSAAVHSLLEKARHPCESDLYDLMRWGGAMFEGVGRDCLEALVDLLRRSSGSQFWFNCWFHFWFCFRFMYGCSGSLLFVVCNISGETMEQLCLNYNDAATLEQ